MNGQIKTTKNYKIFKFHKQNRRLDYKKVDRLAEAITRNNLLNIYPIVVDGANIILDGQHRYAAAKQANAVISYVVSDNNYSIAQVADSNNFQSHWKIDDYVLYYAAAEREDYKKLMHLSNKYMIAPGIIASLEGKYASNADVKAGDFQFTTYDFTVKILELSKLFYEKFKFTHWRRRPFLKALKFISNSSKFNRQKLFEHLENNHKLLVKCYETEEYIYVLQNIYNIGARPGEEVRFL
ncbi:MAG: ParB/RepB/Spo0J family partition protein [Bacteroidetes bacterium]|nr:ParB/RepB/Spo0J family partition protein [Bacteroidota bacterium]